MSLSEAGFTALIPISEVAAEIPPRIAEFSSNSPVIDSFLCDSAKNQYCDHLRHTSLLFHENFDGVAGYITLANDAIPLKLSEVGELGLAYKVDLTSYPAVKIGRLAVHKVPRLL